MQHWSPRSSRPSVLPFSSLLHTPFLKGFAICPCQYKCKLCFHIFCPFPSRHNPWRQQDIYLMEMLMGGLMLIVSIASTLIALRSICTDASSTQPTVHISQRLQQMPRTDGCRHLQTFPDSCRRLQPPRDCAFVSLKQSPLPTGAFEPPPPYPSIPPPMYLL